MTLDTAPLLALFATLLQTPAPQVPAIEPDTVRVELRVRLGSVFDERGEDLLPSNARVQLHRLASSEPFNFRGSLPGAIPDPAWQSQALDPIPVAAAPVDAEGRAVLSVPRGQASARLFAVVNGPGLCRMPSLARVRPAGESTYAGTTHARAGRTVNGRVLNTLGEPVPARIEFGTPLTPHQRFRDLRAEQAARSYPDGTFELDLEPRLLELTSTLDLFADAGEHGTGAWLGVPIAQLLDTDTPLTLRVQGPGVLRGRVVDSDGNPASNVWLRAQATGVDASEALTAAGEGAVLRRVETDPDGAFELRGLAPTAFRISAEMDFGGGDLAWLHDEPLPADGASVELVRDPSVLTVLGGDGEPLATAPYGGLKAWPVERTALFWSAVGPDDPILRFENRTLWTSPSKVNARLHLTSNAPERVTVVLVGGQGPVQHRTVEVRRGSQQVCFETQPDVPLGIALFRLTCPSARLESVNHTLSIEPLDLARPILGSPFYYPFDGTPRIELPAGRYRAVLQGRTPTGHHAEVLGPRRHGRVELEFEIQAGVTQRFELEAAPGGFLEITSSGEITPSDRLAVLAGIAGVESPHRGGFARQEAFVTRQAGQVRLVLHHPQRAPEPLEFLTDRRNAILEAWPETTLGTTDKAEMVPVGDYELVAELPGGRTWRGPVQVREGETTRVEVTF